MYRSEAAINSSTMRRNDIALICALFALALLLHLLLLIPTHFDGLYGQDSYAYYDFAGELRSDLSTGQAPGAFFWPLGYPVLLALGFTLFGQSAATGQVINVLMGAALSPLVYVLARQMGLKPFAALTAGLIMTFCGQALQSSVVLMSDIPALFWALASAVALWHYRSRTDTRTVGEGLRPSPTQYWLVLSVILLAFASITRWIYLVLAVPWALVLLIGWKGRIRWRESLIAITCVIPIFLPQIIYSRTNPYPTLDHAWVEGWSPANFFQNEFTNIDGHFLYEKINAVYYAQPFYDPYYLTPVFTPLLLFGLWGLFKRGWTHLLFIDGWALLPYLFLAGIPYQNIRFPLIVVPAVAVLGGAGIEMLIGWVSTIRPAQRSRWLAWAIAGVVVAYGAMQMFTAGSGLVNLFITNQQRDKDSVAWAVQQIPAGETLYTFGLTLTLKHYSSLNIYELYYETPDTLDAKWIPGQDDYLLINVWNIEHQWVGRDPQLDFHWLRDQRGLTQLGTNGFYTLYRIRG